MLKEAEGRRLTAQNGLPMLVAQAVRASELFTGRLIDNQMIEQVLYSIENELYKD